ncbi:hypothetical protein CPB86DRAFT_106068 [Serendipita vermifera]|nr:hypothetical protein CPB86DRAFT_106068 [Serendipita vermifera]
MEPEFHFRRYWGNSPNYNHLKTPLGGRWVFERVDVIAICYDRSKPETLDNAIHKWYPGVLRFARRVPFFLVGYFYPPSIEGGSDARPQPQQRASTSECTHLVSTREGEEAARRIGAVAYIEWTEGIDEPFAVTKTLLRCGYYYHLDKPFSASDR